MNKSTKTVLHISICTVLSVHFAFVCKCQGIARMDYRQSLYERPADQKEANMISLKEAVTQLKNFYKVKIAYQKGLLDNKTISAVDFKKISTTSAESALSQIFMGFALGYKKTGENQFSLFALTSDPGMAPTLPIEQPFKDETSVEMDKEVKSENAVTKVGGLVKDPKGNGIFGVSVKLKAAGSGTTTDLNGKYNISVPGDGILIFSHIGFVSQEAAVNNRTTINIILEDQNENLGDVVVVGYGSQKKATTTGSISTVSGDKLMAAPAINFTNSLAGRLPGLTVVGTSGEPGRDNPIIRIRGSNTLGDNSPLIVVDGIQNRDINRLNPSDIESVTILKDASAAIYGAQAANGVILITTKRGSLGKPEITLNLNQGWNQPTVVPKMASAATYATMIDEIDSYRGNPPTYTTDEIQKFRDGSDPWLYPNTDWFGEVFKKTAKQNYANMSVSGGTDAMKYFISGGFNYQDGIYKNSATNYSQADFRSNIDGKISDNIRLSVDVVGRQEAGNFPVYSTNQIFSSLITGGAGSGGRPTQVAKYPGDKPNAGFINGLNPVVMGTNIPGYDNEKTYSFLSNAKLTINIPWIKGLSLTGNASYDKIFNYGKRWVKPFDLYSWDRTTVDAQNLPVVTTGKFGPSPDPQLTQSAGDAQNVLLNGLINYQFSITQKHNVKVMAGVEKITGSTLNFSAFRRGFVSAAIDQLFAGSDQQKNNTGSASQLARLNYFGRVNYDYLQKYLLEFVWRYDGSYIFPDRGRFGFFPGVSAGWRVSEEKFWKDKLAFVNYFKIRGSWGKTGNDRIAPYQYLSSYGFSADPYVFNQNLEVKTLAELRIGNPNVTWEVAKQSNIGVDGQLLNGKFSFSADYFHNLRSNILWHRNASVPVSTGLVLPVENIGEVLNHGFEFQVGYNDKIGSFTYGISVNGSSAHNKIKFWDETPGVPDYQKSTGKPMFSGLYYNAIGIFKDQAAVDAYPHWTGARPGDIIFEDVNKDKVIDGKDLVRNPKTEVPTFTGGFSIDLGYKNFFASLFFQGAAGAVKSYVINSGKIGNFLQSSAEGRWTVDNPNASKPRTWDGAGEYWSTSVNNTYWLVDNNYLRLKNMQVGYNIPGALITRIGLSQCAVFFTGLNLVTFTKSKSFDPETIGNTYPLNKVYNLGLRVSFK
jgi:TonB-linked SusC/RagA family outer membrane protein